MAGVVVLGTSCAANWATAQTTPTVTPSSRPSATPRPTPTIPPPKDARVPILMYHYISVPPPNADKYRLDLSVTPKNFEAQLKYLAENGFTTISLYELHAYLNSGRPLPPKPVVLTFDDGYIDNYTEAFPLLKKYRMTGTFFVVSEFASSTNPAYMRWNHIKEMSDAGMSIESHSRAHTDLRTRRGDFQGLVWDTLPVLDQIEKVTGKRPRFFCYPFGKYDDAVIRMLKSEFMLGAVTTDYGKTHTLANAFTWDRVRVHGGTGIAGFASLVSTN
ncbi:MAG: polysaccharide deacetylase family protein [Anaerolineae bacterium]|nr:polysaccharide deacetylase family protein [Anaerolineae bacterium]